MKPVNEERCCAGKLYRKSKVLQRLIPDKDERNRENSSVVSVSTEEKGDTD